jgi:hypothetical protein
MKDFITGNRKKIHIATRISLLILAAALLLLTGGCRNDVISLSGTI